MSAANLISGSSVLLHPSCRKKGLRRIKSRTEPWGIAGDACRADIGAPHGFHSVCAIRQGILCLLIRGLRGFDECLTGIAGPRPLSKAPPCPSCPCCLSLQDKNSFGHGSSLVNSCWLLGIVAFSSSRNLPRIFFQPASLSLLGFKVLFHFKNQDMGCQ